MLRTLEEKVNPAHTAVIVVDVQNDFCHDDCQIAMLGADMSAVQAAVRTIGRLFREVCTSEEIIDLWSQVPTSMATD